MSVSGAGPRVMPDLGVGQIPRCASGRPRWAGASAFGRLKRVARDEPPGIRVTRWLLWLQVASCLLIAGFAAAGFVDSGGWWSVLLGFIVVFDVVPAACAGAIGNGPRRVLRSVLTLSMGIALLFGDTFRESVVGARRDAVAASAGRRGRGLVRRLSDPEDPQAGRGGRRAGGWRPCLNCENSGVNLCRQRCGRPCRVRVRYSVCRHESERKGVGRQSFSSAVGC